VGLTTEVDWQMKKKNPTYDIQVYYGHDELFRVQWTARDVSNVDCCVDNKKFGLLFYKLCQCHPYYSIFLGGSKDRGCGEWRFWCSESVPVKFTMVPNQLQPFFLQNFLVCVEIIFFS
jgi:hypothetical protein